MVMHSEWRRPHFGRAFAFPFWFRFARHGGQGGGRGGPWAGHGRGGGFGWGFGPHGRRRFERGDLKYVILDLLQEGPRHGYDVIRALEERAHGMYSPSPGSVYPILQLLEDQGYVTSSQRDGKRVYTITDSGRAFLKEQEETVQDVRSRMAEGWGGKISPELRGLMDELRQFGQFVFAHGAEGGLTDPDKIRRLRDVVRRARVEVEAIFRGESDTSTML